MKMETELQYAFNICKSIITLSKEGDVEPSEIIEALSPLVFGEELKETLILVMQGVAALDKAQSDEERMKIIVDLTKKIGDKS